jgi:hypothetical protein
MKLQNSDAASIFQQFLYNHCNKLNFKRGLTIMF